MDFLKSAVASISKSPTFPYSFGDRVDIDQSIWTLYNGTRREDNSKCSIFSFDITSNRSRAPLARNALKKLRTLRHPGIVKVLDTVETDQLIYIATERITPLNWSTRRKALSEESLKWGLHDVAKTLKFINDEAASVHGNIRTSSIFTSESGEWKIGGLEILSSMKDDDAVIFNQGSLVPDIGRYSPPEVAKNGWGSVKQNPIHALDAYTFGILMSEVFCGGFAGSDQIGNTKNIPLDMQMSYKRLTHAAPKMRLSVGHFLEQGIRNGGFFDTPLIQLTNGINNLGLKSESEKDSFFTELENVADSDDFPEDFFRVKVLPELMKSVEFGGGGAKSFSLVMRISQKLSEDEYESQLTPVIIRLFASPDRAMRVCLLDNLPHMIDHLSQRVVTDKIFPQMVTGFADLAPVVREQTVKAVLVVVSKLTDRVINGELLRHLAKTANDEQAGIRTNTTICLGKIARNLGPSSRVRVLSAAFSRSLRDPFVHARNAALMALAATVDLFPEEDCATKILPALCPSLVDKEKMVREQANRTLNLFLERVRKYGQTLPEVPPAAPGASSSHPTTRMSTPQPGNQWMGWAISSFTNKLGAASGEIQPNGNGAKPTPMEQRTILTPSSTGAGSLKPGDVPTSSGSGDIRPRPTLQASFTSQPIEDEDFGSGWNDMEDDAADAWGEMDESPHATAPASAHSSKPSTSSIAYDDGGEPDFEGWLNAQAQAKVQGKKPLPKGLTKKATTALSRPTVKRSINSAPGSTKTDNSKPAAPVAASAEKEDDDWGDAWG